MRLKLKTRLILSKVRKQTLELREKKTNKQKMINPHLITDHIDHNSSFIRLQTFLLDSCLKEPTLVL